MRTLTELGVFQNEQNHLPHDGYLELLMFAVEGCLMGQRTGEPVNLTCDWTDLSNSQGVTDKMRQPTGV